MKKVILYISGSVQRAGYRTKAISLAELYNINGIVSNLPDGRVKIVAEGNETDLEQFIIALDIRNALINVTNIDKDYSTSFGEYEGFYKLVSGGETDDRLDTAADLLKELIVVIKDGFNDLGKKQDIMIEKQDIMIEKQDIMIEKQDIMIEKQDIMIEKQDIMIEKQDIMIEKQDIMIEKQDVMIGKQDIMIEKQDVMIGKQDIMIEKQDAMIGKQDTTIEVLKSVKEDASNINNKISSSKEDMKDIFYEKYDYLAREIIDIKANISEIKAKVM
ncbi:Acylphosphatase [Candidatus Methanomarinus sp.]|nr:Acylphosphatase [ANME-2 cluster archaeon]